MTAKLVTLLARHALHFLKQVFPVNLIDAAPAKRVSLILGPGEKIEGIEFRHGAGLTSGNPAIVSESHRE